MKFIFSIYTLGSTDGYDVTIDHVGCPAPDVKLCVDSRMAREKCLALSQVLKSRRIRPGLACEAPISADDDCFSMVASNVAHITTGDGGDVYRAHVYVELLEAGAHMGCWEFVDRKIEWTG